jgi:hypothetical protein
MARRRGRWIGGGVLRLGAAVGVASLLAALGCAAHPVLYPNDTLRETGAETAQQEIDRCLALAKEYGATGGGGAGAVAGETLGGAAVGGATGAAAGAAGGAIVGHAGRGAAIGGAAGAAGAATGGLIRALFHPRSRPPPLERAFVARCLRDRGYEVMGWK